MLPPEGGSHGIRWTKKTRRNIVLLVFFVTFGIFVAS
jgi:hypothetical protein